jgi:hypothetical protein
MATVALRNAKGEIGVIGRIGGDDMLVVEGRGAR